MPLLRHAFFMLACFVFLIAIALRFYQLGSTPYGITNDEASYIYSAYSIWETGRDITGQVFPLSFNLRGSFSPLPAYVIAPFVGLFELSPFFGRLPYALSSIGTVIVLFLLTNVLFRNRWIALATAFTLAISPWHLQLSRGAYEGGIALFLILVGFYVFLRQLRGGNILWSVPFFFLGFHAYHATKLFLLFFLPSLLIFYRGALQKRKDVAVLFGLSFIVLVGSFLIIAQTQQVTRQNVFLWADSSVSSRQVNMEREKTVAPLNVATVFSNKPLFYLRMVRENYLHVFSLDYLFLFGDSVGIYNLYDRGAFYIIELVFLIAGIAFVFTQKDKQLRNVLILCILLAPLPSAFTLDRNYAVRSILLLPFLCMLIGAGIFHVAVWSKKLQPVLRLGLIVGIVCFYGVLLSVYLYQYYFRYPVYGAESWFRSHREAAESLFQLRKTYNTVMVSSPTEEFLLQYAIVNRVDPTVVQRAWKQPDMPVDGNVYFLDRCLDGNEILALPEKTVYLAERSCSDEASVSASRTIPEYKSPNTPVWHLYNYSL